MPVFLFFLALVPAMIFWQAPEFMQQYSQRLGGTTNELARVVRHFAEDARRSDYEPHAAIGVMEKNSERLIRDQATRMKENFVRLERLRQQQEAFYNGGVFDRLASLIFHADQELFEATWQAYKPGIQITFDALLFALIGLVIPWGVMMGFVSAFGGRRRSASAD